MKDFDYVTLEKRILARLRSNETGEAAIRTVTVKKGRTIGWTTLIGLEEYFDERLLTHYFLRCNVPPSRWLTYEPKTGTNGRLSK